MKRREFITLLGGAASAWPLTARAQQPGKVWRIGFLSGLSRPASIESSTYGGFLEGMHQLGYIEGKDFVVEFRFADGNYERYPGFAAEFVELKVHVIVVGTSVAVPYLQRATNTIPIVMGYSIDPIGNGLVASLARPGGNTTGLSSAQEDTVSKHLELIAEAVPNLSRAAILNNPDNSYHPGIVKNAEVVAHKIGLTLIPIAARNAQEIQSAFTAMIRDGVGGAVFLPDPFFNFQRHQIAQLAVRERLPSIFAQREYVEAGGLMSYGESFRDFFRRAASFVDKILKGAKPADLPIEQPTRFFLVINLKTAKALGITVPPTLLTRADEVIE